MSSSRNTSSKASVLKWLPWVLLLVVIAAFIWLFTSMKTASEASMGAAKNSHLLSSKRRAPVS